MEERIRQYLLARPWRRSRICLGREVGHGVREVCVSGVVSAGPERSLEIGGVVDGISRLSQCLRHGI